MSEGEERNKDRSEGEAAGPTRSFDGPEAGPGGQIGPFRIERELGRGAVGVVYLAHDTKLDRSVAIKSLPAEVMANPKARSRFSREARLLASLNHPNIATIHEVLEEAEGVCYLILEYIPGQTLAERIAKRGLKLQEALLIALQIAEAVAAAHEHDVIHRDLKPGNIKITPEGKVKVLDFGLAKAVGGEAEDGQSTVTEPGRIIGTPAYMSPEQARGNKIDTRGDVWSFGCILYEMLTGIIPFRGETVSDTLASILQKEPNWHALAEDTPANIRSLLRRCLEKDPRLRLQDIGDARIEISETLSGASEAFAPPSEVSLVPRLFRRDVVLVGLTCLTAGVLIAGAVFTSLVRPGPPGPAGVSRTSIDIPADKPLFTGGQPQRFLAVSPDGAQLVYVGKLDDKDTGLYMRSMDNLQAKLIPGTKGARNPFFSPDGRWVGFFTALENRLKKVLLAGGEPVTLLEDIPWGICGFGSWAEDGTIVYCTLGFGLSRIPEEGGPIDILIEPDPAEGKVGYRYPQVLPGGKAILCSLMSRSWSNPLSWLIEVFEPDTGKRKTVLEDAHSAIYVWSGHLVFVRDNVLMVAPFDVDRLKITGPLVPIADDVGFDWRGSTPQMAVSRDGTGTMVYVSGSELRVRELVWVDRQGVAKSVGAPAGVYESPRLSPDGRSIAVARRSQKEFTSQVHIYDVLRGKLAPLTTEGQNDNPQWSPDGARIAFRSRISGRSRMPGRVGVLCKAVDSTAPPELLVGEPLLSPYSWSRASNRLACAAQDPETHGDIWVLDMDGDREPRPFLTTEYHEYNPTFSPDGRWLAHVSEESARPEIYLREYIDGGRKIPVSTEGGINPVWSRDGQELYYINGKRMMVVTITSEPKFDVGAPEQLFEWPDEILTRGNLGNNYDVSDDGRFLRVKRSDDAEARLICVHNWFEELKRLAPTGEE